MNKLGIGLALLAITTAAPATAQDAKRFAVEGPGMMTCAAFNAARADKGSAEYQRLLGYVEGYLTAANRYEPNTYDLTPWHNAVAFDLILDNHCTDHAEEQLVTVVQRLVTAMKPFRVAQPSTLVEVGDGTNSAYVYETIVKRAQAALKLKGLYRGAEDGEYSPAMRDALLAFQSDANLTRTGVPDPATLWTLLSP